jgi:4-methylaminobutanoate oxidase (formaldehyde-forming)
LGKHYEIAYPARQWQSARDLRPVPLHQAWVEQRAHFGQIYGWERPLYFDKTVEPTLTFGLTMYLSRSRR